jgi:hypothetical protein
VSVFGGQNADVLEMNVMAEASAAFGHSLFIYMALMNACSLLIILMMEAVST